MRRGFVITASLLLSMASVSTAISEDRLVEAVLQNDIDRVTALLKSGADANMHSADGQGVLYLAAEQGRVEIAKALLDHGADVNATSPTSIESPYLRLPVPGSGFPAVLPNDRKSIQQMASDTPLVIAAWRGHPGVVGLLIARGAKMGFRSAFGWSPLLAAAKNGHRDVALVLLEQGADIEAPNSVGEPPLHVAINFNHPDLAQILMDKGANVNSRSRAGGTPLVAALGGVLNGRQELLDVVNRLLAAGADVNATPTNGLPPLALAANSGNRDLVEAMLKRGVTNDAKTMALDGAIRFGKTAVIETLLKSAADSGVPGPLATQGLLYQAVVSNQIESAKVLLRHGVDVNAHDEPQGTALSYAALKGDLAFVNFLLEQGADPNIVRKGQPSPLVNAADQGRLEIVTALLDRGADVNGGQGATRTPLLVAIQKGHGRIVKTLLDHGAPVNGRGDENLLFAAVWANQSDMAKLLLERGADVTIRPGQRDTYFHLAARQGKVEVVNALLDHGANPNITTDHGRTPLHDVASTPHLDVAKLLLSKGAAVNAEDSDGRTPLHWVSNRGSIEVAAVLVQYGANVNARDKDGNTPLFNASRGNRADLVRLFLAKGAKLNVTNADGQSPLHEAAGSGYLDVVRLLLDGGANVDSRDGYGRTPLHLAYGNGHRELIALLKAKGANETAEDRSGTIPREYGREPEGPEYSREEMVALERTFDQIWHNMSAALKKGDGHGALRFIVEERRPRYERVFNDLLQVRAADGLDKLFGDSFLHCFVPGDDWETVRKDWAHSTYQSYWHRRYVICEMVRTEHGTKYSYEIQFTRDRDNTWRISSF